MGLHVHALIMRGVPRDLQGKSALQTCFVALLSAAAAARVQRPCHHEQCHRTHQTGRFRREINNARGMGMGATGHRRRPVLPLPTSQRRGRGGEPLVSWKTNVNQRPRPPVSPAPACHDPDAGATVEGGRRERAAVELGGARRLRARRRAARSLQRRRG